MAGTGIPPNLRIGTSSWSSEDWIGTFYPEGCRPADFLGVYSSTYDTVEIDATFYRIPSARMVEGWKARTPAGFTFAAKVPRVITHDKQLEDCDEELDLFLGTMRGLGERLGPLLFQFPYVSKRRDPVEYGGGEKLLTRLKRVLDRLPSDLRYVVEIRNEKWLRGPLPGLLRERNVALALIDYFTMPAIGRLLDEMDPLTADLLYVRFLGDHKRMDRIVRQRAEEAGGGKLWSSLALDRTREMTDWVRALRALCPRVGIAYAFVNNHYAGYAPGSIDLLKSLFADTRD